MEEEKGERKKSVSAIGSTSIWGKGDERHCAGPKVEMLSWRDLESVGNTLVNGKQTPPDIVPSTPQEISTCAGDSLYAPPR